MLGSNLLIMHNFLQNNIITLENLTNDKVIQNDFYISAFMIGFLLASLVLTFSRSGSAIHKVLGLLLTSIFTVFLWMFKTQLLFIYIVYILAFISAVLMLFLSVVMMLPISTISPIQRSAKLSFVGTISLIDISTEVLFLSLIIVIGLCFIQKVYTFIFASNNFIKDSERYINAVATSNTEGIGTKVYYLVFKLVDGFTINRTSYLGVWQKYFWDVHFIIIGRLKGYFNQPVILKTASTFLDLAIILVHIFLGLSFKLYIGLKEYGSYLYIALVTVGELVAIYKKDLLDVAQQTYMMMAIVLPFLLVTTAPVKDRGWLMPNFDTIQGIGGIKELLYADFSLFLIFSTVVLLVALFGAAIMTRKK